MKSADKTLTSFTRKIFELTPKQIGKDRPLIAISQSSQKFAIGSPSSSTILFFTKLGEPQEQILLPSNSIPTNIAFDSADTYLSILCKERSFLYKTASLESPPVVVECETGNFSASAWSLQNCTIAFGSTTGAIIFYNLKTNKRVNTVGKHSKKVNSLVWNANCVLLSIADDKTICASKASGENEEAFADIIKLNIQDPEKAIWISTSGISSISNNQSPKETNSNKIAKNDLSKKMANEDKGSSDKISKSEKFEFAIGCISKSGKSLNLIIPGNELICLETQINPNYGKFVDFGTSSTGEIIAACSRGYLAKFTFCNGNFEELKSEKVFQNSIEFAKFETDKSRAVVLGDNSLRFVEFDNLKELKDYKLSFEKNAGNFTGLNLTARGEFLLASTNSGYVFGILVRTEFLNKFSAKIFATKISFNQINFKILAEEFTAKSSENFEGQPGFAISFPGSEISDFCLAQNRVFIIQEKTLSCFDIADQKTIFQWKMDHERPIEKIFASEKGRLLLVTTSGVCVMDVSKPANSVLAAEFKNAGSAVFRFSHEFTSVLANGNLLIYDNETLEVIISKSFKESFSDFYMNEQTLEFYLYNSASRKLFYYSLEGKNAGEEIELPDKASLKKLIFDEADPSVFCLHFDSGKVYTVCKVTRHYKTQLSFKTAREVLSVEDLTEQRHSDFSVTFLDTEIAPLRLKAGFLTCVEQGNTLTGIYLASHSFMLGALSPNFQSIELESLENFPQKQNPPVNQNPQSQNSATFGNQLLPLNKIISENEKEYYLKSFLQAAELGNFSLALKASQRLDSKILWDALGRQALEHLDLRTAAAAFQRLSNFSMSHYIGQLAARQRPFDDLRCEVAIILCNYDFAHRLFLEIGRPEKAAELRCHLHEFQIAAEICRQFKLEKFEMHLTLELADQALKNEEFIRAQSLYEELLQKISGALTQKIAKEVSLNEKGTRISAKNLPRENLKDLNGLIKTEEALLYKRALFGLCSLFIRQANTLRATQTLLKIENESREEIEELAELANEFGQFALSAELFAKIGMINKEIEVCLQAAQNSTDNSKFAIEQFISKLRTSLPKLTDPEILLKSALFIQNKENDLAEVLFQKSENVVEYVKFLLFVRKNVEKAEAVFEKNKLNAKNAANYLAEFYSQSKDSSQATQRKAIRYFLLSGGKIEAFKKAFESGNIEFYCECVENFDPKEAIILARYFNANGIYSKAGKFYMIANEHEKALLSFMRAKDFDEAIELVFKLNDDDLFDLMVQILAGETAIPETQAFDNSPLDLNFVIPKKDLDSYFREGDARDKNRNSNEESRPSAPVDPIYLFKLYLRFEKIEQANTIALAIIDRELTEGSYKSAHQHAALIFSQMSKLRAKIRPELRNKFIILQSYSIVKRALKHNKHHLAALLLNRVCGFVHYLSKNSAEIMTSAVIESTKAGFKLIAYNWALTLCKPQYRPNINPKYKEKIEKIALKPIAANEFGIENNIGIGWSENLPKKAESGACRCPNCHSSVQDAFGMACPACLANFLICIASGKAILGLQETLLLGCRSCAGVGYKVEVMAFLEKESVCPMCEERKDLEGFVDVGMDAVKEFMKE